MNCTTVVRSACTLRFFPAISAMSKSGSAPVDIAGDDDSFDLGAAAGRGSHRIPAIDKMLDILDLLLAEPDGASIAAICEGTTVPRSTVYRILNTLAARGVVTRTGDGVYQLGYRLVNLAKGVRRELKRDDLIRLVHPILIELAAATGETCKLSVLAELEAEVIDVVTSERAMAPTSKVGSTFPLHAGAASKALLAHAPEQTRTAVLKGKLSGLTPNTLTSERALLDELEEIARTGLSHDRGEWSPAVHAIAAPIYGLDGTVTAALSVTYFAVPEAQAREAELTGILSQAARRASQALGGI